MQVIVERMKKLETAGKLKAFVDLNFNGLVVKGFKIFEGPSGLFLGVPSVKDKNDKYQDQVFFKEKTDKEDVQEIVLAAYNTTEA